MYFDRNQLEEVALEILLTYTCDLSNKTHPESIFLMISGLGIIYFTNYIGIYGFKDISLFHLFSQTIKYRGSC